MTRQKVIIANGVNLDLLGQREPEIYGRSTLKDIELRVREVSPQLAKVFRIDEPELFFFQTNAENDFLAMLSQSWSGALINAGAWTHTSLALGDRLAGIGLPFVEIHISNISSREPIRHQSFLSRYALGVCYGFGPASYISGLSGLYEVFGRTA